MRYDWSSCNTRLKIMRCDFSIRRRPIELKAVTEGYLGPEAAHRLHGLSKTSQDALPCAMTIAIVSAIIAPTVIHDTTLYHREFV